MAESFRALGIPEIQGLNKAVIDRFGGIYIVEDCNFHNRGSLEHIIEATLFPVFGTELYPTVSAKIAATAQIIITGHVFHDGNKRTALAVIKALAVLNGLSFAPIEEDMTFLTRIAAENIEIGLVEEWLKTRLKPCLAI